jgi:hypothetical protein
VSTERITAARLWRAARDVGTAGTLASFRPERREGLSKKSDQPFCDRILEESDTDRWCHGH